MAEIEERWDRTDEVHWQGRTRLLIDYVLVGTVLCLALTFIVGRTPYFPIDLEITRALQSLRSPVLDEFMILVGYPGLFPQVIPLNAFIILALYLCRLKWESITLMVMGPIVGIASTLLRYSIDRPRPTPNLVWVAQEIEKGHFSYPSGHALGFMAIFGFLWFLGYTLIKPSWQRTLLLIAYAALIAFVGIGRVYVGEHWASDVFGGYLIGSVYLALTIAFYEWGKRYLWPRIAPHLP